MHPRSPYNEYTDFRQLASDCPSLARYVHPTTSQLNFKDPDAVRELAASLLKRDFSLDVELPPDRLCPMVPNRLNYILWLQDLLDTTCDSPVDASPDHARPVVGLDIGTGASVIYPLLGCASRTNWNFIGTDIDPDSLDAAQANVARNALADRIRIFASSPEKPLLPLDELGVSALDFSMTNPPFYASLSALSAAAESKSLPPSSACTGTPTEMVYTPNGEVGFALRILSESRELRERVRWYTVMLGTLSSVATLTAELKKTPALAGNWAVAEFVQGKTKRWGVGWSFCDARPAEAAARPHARALEGCLPFPSEFVVGGVEQMGGMGAVRERVTEVLGALDAVRFEWISEREEVGTAVFEVTGNVWARAARRAKARGHAIVDMSDADVAVGVKLAVTVSVRQAEVRVRWRQGRDSVLFESFCGMLKRKLVLG